MIEWLIIPGYFGCSFVAYKVMHHIDFKQQFNWYVTDLSHKCMNAHPNNSHDKWAYDCAMAEGKDSDFAASSLFWPFLIFFAVMDFLFRTVKSIPSGGKITKQVESAEAQFQLKQFAKREGLPWNQDN